MNDFLSPDDISNLISLLIKKNKLWEEKNVRIFFISNKFAGCFTNKKLSRHYKKIINFTQKEIASLPDYANSVSTKVFTTEYSGHGKDLANAIIAEFIGTFEPESECIIVSAGGDGTSLEMQTTVYTAAQSEPKKMEMVKNHITLLRLPLGTGNDGTDGHCLEETIELLKGPLKLQNACALKIYPEGSHTSEDLQRLGKNPAKYCNPDFKAPWYCFNIASIGLDAYVVYMTNSVKKKLPGNFYHLCVPLSGLVYDKDFPTGNAKIELFDKDGIKTEEVNAPITLVAVGASGHRVYGGGHKVLPNEHNVCITPKVSLPRLIRDNHQFIDGSFVGTDLASLHSAEKVRISYDQAILLQADGEVAMLCKEDFPIVIEKTEPCIRIITSSNNLA